MVEARNIGSYLIIVFISVVLKIWGKPSSKFLIWTRSMPFFKVLKGQPPWTFVIWLKLWFLWWRFLSCYSLFLLAFLCRILRFLLFDSSHFKISLSQALSIWRLHWVKLMTFRLIWLDIPETIHRSLNGNAFLFFKLPWRELFHFSNVVEVRIIHLMLLQRLFLNQHMLLSTLWKYFRLIWAFCKEDVVVILVSVSSKLLLMLSFVFFEQIFRCEYFLFFFSS